LAGSLEQSVRLGTLYDSHVLVLHHVRRGSEEDHPSDVGLLLPLGSTALGRVLVSERPDLVGVCLSRERGTPSDCDRLIDELQEITERGWTWLTRDPVPWQDSVAAPIRDRRGEIVAAIAISGLAGALIDSGEGVPCETLVHKLVGAARAVSRAMEARAE
jgi:DNA-binding IclR family transcriptional regulator